MPIGLPQGKVFWSLADDRREQQSQMKEFTDWNEG